MPLTVDNLLPAAWTDAFAANAPRLGIGYDVATTTKGKSNPSAIAVTQQVGLNYIVRLLLRFKTADPAVPRDLLGMILTGLPHGLRVRRVCVDASNERYFAADLKRSLVGLVPVELVVSGEATEYLGERMSMKDYLGNLLVNTLDDGYLALPPKPWLKTDLRQVVRERGTFQAEVAEDGGHADCFDAIKLSLHALITGSGPAEARAVGPVTRGSGSRPGLRNPFLRRLNRTQLNA